MYSEKPVGKDYSFMITPKSKDKKQHGSSPQEAYMALMAQKDAFLNLADDDLVFMLFTESEFKNGKTLADPSEGENPSANTFIPTFMQVETIGFHQGKLTIAFKDSEKKYIRNLANVRVYNHVDPDPQDDISEEVNGAIFDALNFYNYQKNRVLHSDVNKLQTFKSVMFRILGSNGLQNKGKKCDIVQFENTMNTKQELMFLCQCNEREPRAECKFVN